MAPGIDLRHPDEELAIPVGLQGPRVTFDDAYLVLMSFAVIGSMLAAWISRVIGPVLTHGILGAKPNLDVGLLPQLGADSDRWRPTDHSDGGADRFHPTGSRLVP